MYLNITLPSPILLIILTVVLFLLSIQSGKKAYSVYVKENKVLNEKEVLEANKSEDI